MREITTLKKLYRQAVIRLTDSVYLVPQTQQLTHQEILDIDADLRVLESAGLVESILLHDGQKWFPNKLQDVFNATDALYVLDVEPLSERNVYNEIRAWRITAQGQKIALDSMTSEEKKLALHDMIGTLRLKFNIALKDLGVDVSDYLSGERQGILGLVFDNTDVLH